MPDSGRVGKAGEDAAVKLLKSRGYKILFRNWRTPRWGEIDVVSTRDNILVFVEVKARTSGYGGKPFEAVNFYKLRSLKRAMMYFKAEHPETPEQMRLDIVSATIIGGKIFLEHIKNVYEDTLN